MKKDKSKKVTFFIYSPYECTAVEEYLEMMAEKGWLLESIYEYFFKFKRIEPKKLKYSVEASRRLSIYDEEDTEKSREYREYCIAAGWNYVCQENKLLIFYTEDENKVIPIETDDEEKFKNIFNASIPRILMKISILILFAMQLYFEFIGNRIKYAIAFNSSLFVGILYLIFIAILLTEIMSFFIWAVRSKIGERRHKFTPYNDYKRIKRKNKLKKGYILVFIILALFITRSPIDDNNPSQLSNIKLTAEDFNLNDAMKDKERERFHSSILAKYMRYSSFYDDEYRFDYEILQSEHSWIIDFYKKRALSGLKENNNVEAISDRFNFPNGVEVYSISRDKLENIFILSSRDRFIEIHKDIKDISDEEFIKIVYEKCFKEI